MIGFIGWEFTGAGLGCKGKVGFTIWKAQEKHRCVFGVSLSVVVYGGGGCLWRFSYGFRKFLMRVWP